MDQVYPGEGTVVLRGISVHSQHAPFLSNPYGLHPLLLCLSLPTLIDLFYGLMKLQFGRAFLGESPLIGLELEMWFVLCCWGWGGVCSVVCLPENCTENMLGCYCQFGQD